MWTSAEFPHECRRLASIAFDRYGRDIAPLYLVGIKRDGRWITAIVSYELADGESYIIATHIPRNLALARLTDWFETHLRSEPVLSPE